MAAAALGRQELDGEIVLDAEGALWTWEMLEAARAAASAELDRIVVAVDPPVTGGADADECGIVVAGRRDDRAAAGLARRGDRGRQRRRGRARRAGRSGRWTLYPRATRPTGWWPRSTRAATGRAPDPAGRSDGAVSARCGRRAARRCGPSRWRRSTSRGGSGIAGCSGRSRTRWRAMTSAASSGAGSPDRVDALVWAITELMIDPAQRSSAPRVGRCGLRQRALDQGRSAVGGRRARSSQSQEQARWSCRFSAGSRGRRPRPRPRRRRRWWPSRAAGRAAWSARDTATLTRVGFLGNPVAFRCVKIIAEAAAAVPVVVQDADRRFDVHPVLDLLAAPNPGQGGAALLEAFYGHLLLSGDGYLEAAGEVGVGRAARALRAAVGPDEGGAGAATAGRWPTSMRRRRRSMSSTCGRTGCRCCTSRASIRRTITTGCRR